MTTAPTTRTNRTPLAVVPDPAGESTADSAGITPPPALVSIPVKAIAPHPDNVRHDLGDLDGLGQSIKEHGLLQPLLVVTVADHKATHPEHKFGRGITHVAHAGHRRHAAAKQAGVKELAAVVIPAQHTATAYVTMLHENLLRQGLTPLEEARGLSLLADTGLSQRQIAAVAQVSQSHVSKRLSLLRLPEDAQAALTADKITVEEAISLAGLGAAHREVVWGAYCDEARRYHGASLRGHIRRHHDEQERAKKVAKHRAEAEAQGFTIIESAEDLWNSAWRYSIHSEKQIAAAKKNGTLVVEPTSWGLRYYATDAAEGSVSAADAKIKDEQREQRAAMRARTDAARAYVRDQIVPDAARTAMMRAAVIQVVLVDRLDYANSLRMAYKWIGDLVGEQPATPTNSQPWYDWIRSMSTRPEHQRLFVAWAMHIANCEARARHPYGSHWQQRDLDYLDALVDHGYALSDWENKRYKAAAKHLAT